MSEGPFTCEHTREGDLTFTPGRLTKTTDLIPFFLPYSGGSNPLFSDTEGRTTVRERERDRERCTEGITSSSGRLLVHLLEPSTGPEQLGTLLIRSRLWN